MIAGDVTANGNLKYSGPGNDRGAIISQIITEGGTNITSVITGGYWFEDASMNNELKYTGSGNDRAYIVDNLIVLNATPYLNNTYTSVVPGAYTGGKEVGTNDGPFDIQFVESAQALSVDLLTNELIEEGLVDNIQFTLAWKAGDTEIADMLNSYTSDFMLAPQGEAVGVDGVMHLVYVSVNPIDLPQVFDEGEQVSVLSFVKESGISTTGRLWIADNEYTANNNAMYYVSVWGTDHTGMILSPTVGVEDLLAENSIRIYPNPTSDKLVYVELNLANLQEVSISILNMQGGMISTENYQPVAAGLSKTELSLLNLTKGVYFIKVNGDKLNIIQKLVIQ